MGSRMMDRYRAILNTIDGEVVADMVKGVCAGYYLADDVDKRITKLEAQLDKVRSLPNKWRELESDDCHTCFGVDGYDCADELQQALEKDE